MIPFTPYYPPVSVPNNQDLPKEMDIFYKDEASFLPPGKAIGDLTPEELRTMQSQYRFSPLRPGIYQGITGISNRKGGSM